MKMKHTISKSLGLMLLCSCVCLGAAGSSQDDPVGIVLEILRSGEQEMQAVAIAMVKEMPGPEVTKALAKELPNLSAVGQVQLLSALGDRGDAAALPAVVAATKAKDPPVRIAALRAMGQLGDASSVEMLAQAAASSSGEEQKAARASLYRLRDPQADQAILVGIQKADAPAKVELISAIGERNIRASVSTLLKTARDEDRKVRTESIRVLKVVASPAELPALVELLINAKSPLDRGETQKTVVAVAHKIEDRDRQGGSVLAVLPSVTEVQARCSLLSVLGKIGDRNALPVLTAALKDSNAEIQAGAIRALADWPTPEPASELLNVAQNSGNKVHKILALRGFIRLLGLENTRSADETLAMYKKAMGLATDTAEKKNVLSGLAGVKSLAAMNVAAEYLNDENLSNEAGFAAIKIAQGIHKDTPGQAMDMLKKIVQTTKSDSLRQQAQEAIDGIERPDETRNRLSEKENQ